MVSKANSHNHTVPKDPVREAENKAYKEADDIARRTSLSFGSHGYIVISPCGTRVIKHARPGSCRQHWKQNLEALLRECEVYCSLPECGSFLKFYGLTASRDAATLTLEYMKNGDLHNYIRDHPDQDLKQRMSWCVQIINAVRIMHQHWFIHSDLRPQNVLVADDLTLRLIDFSGTATRDKKNLAAEGTRYYMPRDDYYKTSRNTDRFALGSTMYYIMTGKEPYYDMDRDLVDDEFAKKRYPKVDHLLIGEVILKCWKGEYEFMYDVYKDLYSLWQAANPETIKSSSEQAKPGEPAADEPKNEPTPRESTPEQTKPDESTTTRLPSVGKTDEAIAHQGSVPTPAIKAEDSKPVKGKPEELSLTTPTPNDSTVDQTPASGTTPGNPETGELKLDGRRTGKAPVTGSTAGGFTATAR
ncbi:Protein kinase-like domain protein [Niveomyces insectorum RCEF 264]|uniref:EKC/KEOPS complex subunit BUD32 n=1 Tax=Niveomyces insectorum RCEF 264 TaxID=1081102 RepID=A0A167WV43_9HYPO|nr:Protein kinase-like domain protein [Niveomyces insectorum RCEF 264]